MMITFGYLPQQNETCSETAVIQAYTRSQIQCGTKTVILLATNLPSDELKSAYDNNIVDSSYMVLSDRTVNRRVVGSSPT